MTAVIVACPRSGLSTTNRGPEGTASDDLVKRTRNSDRGSGARARVALDRPATRLDQPPNAHETRET